VRGKKSAPWSLAFCCISTIIELLVIFFYREKGEKTAACSLYTEGFGWLGSLLFHR
jgi:hypothetical protein